MKTLIGVFLVGFCSVANAWEVDKNPDRFVSFGFNVSSSRLEGSRTESNLPNNPALNLITNNDGSVDFDTVGGDIRLPVHRSITLTLSYDKVTTSSSFVRSENVYQTKDNLSGSRYGLGMRFYLNK